MIFTITTITDNSPERLERTWGFYLSEQSARHAVFRNLGNMEDSLYDYLIIEEVEPGVIAMTKKEIWFKWDVNKWQPCNQPDFAKHLTGWAMG